MDFERELQPVRNLVYAFALFASCAVAILATPALEAPSMHKPPNMWELREALAQAAEGAPWKSGNR